MAGNQDTGFPLTADCDKINEVQVQPVARKLAWGAAYFYVACMVAYVFIHFGGLNFYPRASFDLMLSGKADKPYVGRMLVPQTINWINEQSPDGLKQTVANVIGSDYFLPDYYGVPKDPIQFPYAVTILLIFAALMYTGIAFGGRAAYIAVYGNAGPIANLVGLLYLLAVPLWFRYTGYIYDPMTILLATWILYAATKSNIWLCCVLFILACCNKETAPLLLPVIGYGIWRKRGIPIAVGSCVALLIAAVLIQLHRLDEFSANGGLWTEPHWLDHQVSLVTQYTMSFLYAFAVMAAFLWLALKNFKQKPMILRVGLCCTLIPLFLASIPFGFVDEIRALYDSYPFVTLLAIPTAFAFFAGVNLPTSQPA